jgi:hypothetical protein
MPLHSTALPHKYPHHPIHAPHQRHYAMAFSIRVHTTRAYKTQHMPTALASDIARIVDPTYAFGYGSSSAASSPTTTTFAYQPQAYVDEAGCMHDPDYRAFPALPARAAPRRPSSPIRYSSFGYYDSEDDEDEAAAAGASYFTKRSSRSTASSPTRPEPVNFYHRASFEESVLFEEVLEPEETPGSTDESKDSGRSR